MRLEGFHPLYVRFRALGRIAVPWHVVDCCWRIETPTYYPVNYRRLGGNDLL